MERKWGAQQPHTPLGDLRLRHESRGGTACSISGKEEARLKQKRGPASRAAGGAQGARRFKAPGWHINMPILINSAIGELLVAPYGWVWGCWDPHCSGTKSAAKASWQQTCAADSGFGEAKWSGSGGHSSPTPRQAVCGRHTRRGFSLSEAESVYASFFSRRRRAPGEAGARAPFKPRGGV